MAHITDIDEIEVGNEESDTSPLSAEGMSQYMKITVLGYKGVVPSGGELLLKSYNLLYQGADAPNTNQDDPATPWDEVDDINGNGFVDLDDFYNQPLLGLWPVPPAGGVSGDGDFSFRMSLTFHSDAGNDYQGDRVSFNIAGTLHD